MIQWPDAGKTTKMHFENHTIGQFQLTKILYLLKSARFYIFFSLNFQIDYNFEVNRDVTIEHIYMFFSLSVNRDGQ